MEATIRTRGEERTFAGLLVLGLFALYVVALDQVDNLVEHTARALGAEAHGRGVHAAEGAVLLHAPPASA